MFVDRNAVHERSQIVTRVGGEGEPGHCPPPTPRPLPVHALRPECGRAIGVSKCCGWCRRAPTAPALGARTQLGDLTSSHLPRASCRRVCQGAARTERLLAHHGAARLCFSSPHPAPVAVVAHSQHGAWRAWSCARVYGTAGEQDLHSLLPSATTGPSSIHRSPPRPPPRPPPS